MKYQPPLGRTIYDDQLERGEIPTREDSVGHRHGGPRRGRGDGRYRGRPGCLRGHRAHLVGRRERAPGRWNLQRAWSRGGAALTGPGPRLARVLGGGMGGAVAGYFAVSSAELVYPATAQWAYIGGAFAALFALPVAAVAGGLFGLLSAVFRSRANGNTSTKDKFKEAFDE